MSLEHWDIRVGNSLLELKKIPKESIQTVVTSPPYWGLRDYGHDSQLGAENTPDEYVDGLVDVFREIRRVLKKDGTVWLNLGDSYPTGKIEGLKPKDLAGIPWRVAFALQEDGWWLRSDIIWHKPNPMPESVTDRPTKSHEYIFLLTKNPRYYYDADAVREPHTWEENNPRLSGMERNAQKYRDKVYGGGCSGFAGHSGTRKADGSSLNHPLGKNKRTVWTEDDKNIKGNMSERGVTRTTEGLNLKSAEEKQHPLGRNKRDVWTVNTKPFPEAHFATFPEKLIDTCIKAGTKENDIVLDPFSGAGTTGVVACKLNRIYIGIELNPEYAEMSKNRLAKTVGTSVSQAKDIKSPGVQLNMI